MSNKSQSYNYCSTAIAKFFPHFSAPVADFYEEIAASLSDDEGKKVRRNINRDYYNENELKLQCCVLMLDVILKQVCNDDDCLFIYWNRRLDIVVFDN